MNFTFNRFASHLASHLAAAFLCLGFSSVHADDFSRTDLERWQTEFMTVVKEGDRLFHGGLGNKNGVSCDQCHPNAANTHPETYPKFQKQLGKVSVLSEMINWCIRNPLESEPLALDDAKMTALQAYIYWERRKVALEPGKH